MPPPINHGDPTPVAELGVNIWDFFKSSINVFVKKSPFLSPCSRLAAGDPNINQNVGSYAVYVIRLPLLSLTKIQWPFDICLRIACEHYKISKNHQRHAAAHDLVTRIQLTTIPQVAAIQRWVWNWINNNNSCAFSYTRLTPKDDEVYDVTTLWPEAYYIVIHKYCYMPKYTGRS